MAHTHVQIGLTMAESGDPDAGARRKSETRKRPMEHPNDPPPIPKDATKATERQRELQNKLDHQDEDPNAPGRHQTKDHIADET